MLLYLVGGRYLPLAVLSTIFCFLAYLSQVRNRRLIRIEWLSPLFDTFNSLFHNNASHSLFIVERVDERGYRGLPAVVISKRPQLVKREVFLF